MRRFFTHAMNSSRACVPWHKAAAVALPLAIVTAVAVWLSGQRPSQSSPTLAPQAPV